MSVIGTLQQLGRTNGRTGTLRAHETVRREEQEVQDGACNPVKQSRFRLLPADAFVVPTLAKNGRMRQPDSC